jgi:hypothetical protein
MRRQQWLVLLGASLALFALAGGHGQAGEVPAKYRPAIDKGLSWLVKQQKRDGRWEANRGTYPTAMTSLAGLALLSQGSTLREGKYRDNLRKATDWLLEQSRPDGLLASPDEAKERYIHGHGFAMLFLAAAAGDLEEGPQRRRALRALERAVRFARAAQGRNGGWGYVSAKEGMDFEEESPTLTIVHGLRAARSAGTRLPPQVLEDGREYLKYLGWPLDRGKAVSPALIAGALAACYAPADYNSPQARTYLAGCQTAFPPPTGRGAGYHEYAHFYFAQVVYALGDDGWARLFPGEAAAKRLTWTAYRRAAFDALMSSQARDGSWGAADWTAQGVGPVYSTAVWLCVLQLDRDAVPIFGRAPR